MNKNDNILKKINEAIEKLKEEEIPHKKVEIKHIVSPEQYEIMQQLSKKYPYMNEYELWYEMIKIKYIKEEL